MFLIQILPLTKIPHTLPQILSYFSGQKLFAGSLIQIPLGKRKANGVVIGVRAIADHKMEIKRADFELRNIAKIISAEPILTEKQIKLALFLGQYYFASPGLFAKMMFTRRSFNAGGLPPKQQTTNNKQLTVKKQTLIVFPTISQAENYAKNKKTLSLWHSGLTAKQLNESWWKIKNGRAQTIIGTRSAVFLPFTGLKKIIIVDESNPNHKSWDMFPHYRVHEVAQKLAEIFNAKLTIPAGRGYSLRATTPSLSAPRILRGGTPPCAYSRVSLNLTPTIIDMRAELKSGNFSIFSVDLYEAVKNALEKKKQVILFINRRGAANFILCRDCGYIAKCPNCDAPLAYHLINNKPSLLCHHCGAKDILPSICPKCQSWRIKTVGSGTQKVEAEAQKFFPDAKILRLDGDIAPKAKDQQKIIADFIDKKTDILIATPMIFSWLVELAAAKPAVVGILSADTLLHIPDFRSGERTWQMIKSLQSVIASAAPLERRGAKLVRSSFSEDGQSRNIAAVHGIATLPTVAHNDSDTPHFKKGGLGGILNQSRLLIQTYNPANSVLKYVKNNDYKGFIKEDTETRQALNYPPFSQIVKLTFRLRDPKTAGQEAKILAAKLKNVIASPAFAKRSNPEYSKNNQLTSSPQTCPASRERRGEGGLRRGVDYGVLASARDGSPTKVGTPDTTSPQPPPQLRRGGKNDIEISPALPAFLPRERGKFVWNIILKFLPLTIPHFVKGGLGGIFTSPDFLGYRNSLLQYVPQNWEIDVDPENLL